MERTPTYELARTFIAAFEVANGALPTLAELTAGNHQQHKTTPSQSTLAKALRVYKAVAVLPKPSDPDQISFYKTIRAQADARAEARLEVR